MRLWKKGLVSDSIKKFQLDIVACATNGTETCHILGALPTGYGKSLPMLVTGLLMPPGEYSLNIFNCSILTKIFLKRFHSPCNQPFDYNRPAVNQRLQQGLHFERRDACINALLWYLIIQLFDCLIAIKCKNKMGAWLNFLIPELFIC